MLSGTAHLKAVWAYIRTHPVWGVVVVGLGYIAVFSPRTSVSGAWFAAVVTVLALMWIGGQSMVRPRNAAMRLSVATLFLALIVAVVFYCRWSTSARPSNTDAAQREVVTQADQKGASHVAVQPPAPVSQEKSVVSPSPQPEKHRQPQKGGSRHAPSELAPPNKSDRASQAQKGRADRPKATAPPVTKEEVRVIEARRNPVPA